LKFDNAQKVEAGKRGKNNVLLQIQSLYTPGRSRKKQIPISYTPSRSRKIKIPISLPESSLLHSGLGDASEYPKGTHELTFSCYRREPYFNDPVGCKMLLEEIENTRQAFHFDVWA
jgi:hypothetical protein